MAKRKSRKKTTTKAKTKDEIPITPQIEETNESIIGDAEELTNNNHNETIEKDIVSDETIEDKLIPDIDSLNEKDLKTKVLQLENENAELLATIEKARKKLRIYSKKLDLTEEREDQWKLACYNIAGMFAEKSQISLDDVLKRFEAPIEDSAI